MIEGLDRAALTEVFLSRRSAIREALADSITALPMEFLEVCEDTSVLFRFTPERWMRNPSDVVHGGVVCTMLDNAMGSVSGALAGKMTPTVNMQVDFIRPVRLDTPILVRVECITQGSTLCRMRASLWQDNENKPCASGTAVYFTK